MPSRARAGSSRPEISREFIAVHKRRRIMDAIAELSAEQGYEATRIGDIVRRAGVARKTLYDNFDGKEEVFLSAFDAAFEELRGRVEEACAAAEGDWDERLGAGLAVFLGFVAEKPALARMCMIEALSATPAAKERYEEALEAFVELVAGTAPRDDRLPETIDETVVGGVAWIVYQKIRRGEAGQAEDLLPELTEFATAPYLGAATAAKRAGT
jgi:AcrR family transcriptional regulator